ELVRSGKIVGSTVTPFQLAELGVAVKAGAPKPNIGTAEAYKSALLGAKSIGYSRGCSGTNIGAGIAQLGLTDALKAKTVFTTTGPVTDYLARGDFEIGLQQTNIMAGVPGVDFVGPVPAPLNRPCQSNVGVATTAKGRAVERRGAKRSTGTANTRGSAPSGLACSRGSDGAAAAIAKATDMQ